MKRTVRPICIYSISSNVNGRGNERHERIVFSPDWVDRTMSIAEELRSKEKPFDAVIVTAGGWAGGKIGSEEGLRGVDAMWRQCMQSAAMGGYLGANLLKENGLLVFTGAAVVAPGQPPSGTNGMVGYGMAKAATHHLCLSMCLGDRAGGEPDDLPRGSHVLTVMPETIDTAMNRQFMPDADFGAWTPAEEIADKIIEWATNEGHVRPPDGSLVRVRTENHKTTWDAISP